ncbi:hypothetical protein H5410_011340 [Solanum commersonii]|uniref:ACB domain-containing protein n=1 Tax=Solanum commersonii TaxID=4109 RepID=A0A9J6APN0_SOLCO|nr:hypothetical protein H5410_011340 [Solanum commersonii]
MAMARVSSGLAYPERFYAAASYAGFDGSSDSSTKGVSSKFSNDAALLLYALYQQATVGPCKIPKPRSWSPVEQSKWTRSQVRNPLPTKTRSLPFGSSSLRACLVRVTSPMCWNGLGNMASTEAMRLFVKILEEEDPGWYSRASNFVSEPAVQGEKNNETTAETVTENGNVLPEIKTIPAENGILSEPQDKDVVSEGSGAVGVYDQWVSPPISGPRPKSRYEHGAAVIDDKMYIFGGNHNGRYLSDLQALDLRSWTWSKVEVKTSGEAPVAPFAGHSLIPWGGNKLISIGGHTKDPSETMQVKVFDMQTHTWSNLKTYGKPPLSRGGHSVTPTGTSLVIFGGQDANRSLLNDLHILDLETMTWDEMDTLYNIPRSKVWGVAPSPRSDHAAAVHAERYLLIFGGGSHATCFNDLHVLDLQTVRQCIQFLAVAKLL